jgi:hypothetical protein
MWTRGSLRAAHRAPRLKVHALDELREDVPAEVLGRGFASAGAGLMGLPTGEEHVITHHMRVWGDLDVMPAGEALTFSLGPAIS